MLLLLLPLVLLLLSSIMCSVGFTYCYLNFSIIGFFTRKTGDTCFPSFVRASKYFSEFSDFSEEILLDELSFFSIISSIILKSSKHRARGCEPRAPPHRYLELLSPYDGLSVSLTQTFDALL